MQIPNKGIEKACRNMGGNAALAAAVGASDNFVSQWKTGARPVPLKYKDAICKKGGVLDYEVWPHIYAAPKRKKSSN